MSIVRAKENMYKLERDYDATKAQIEFNVANKPLLVEQGINHYHHNNYRHHSNPFFTYSFQSLYP